MTLSECTHGCNGKCSKLVRLLSTTVRGTWSYHFAICKTCRSSVVASMVYLQTAEATKTECVTLSNAQKSVQSWSTVLVKCSCMLALFEQLAAPVSYDVKFCCQFSVRWWYTGVPGRYWLIRTVCHGRCIPAASSFPASQPPRQQTSRYCCPVLPAKSQQAFCQCPNK